MKVELLYVRAASIFLFACSVLWGQAVSEISGTAKDITGAVVPGVEVTATQTDTGAKRTTTTDEAGDFVLSNLALGPYRLDATKAGFRTYVQTGIVLQVGTNAEIPITMGVGQVSDSVQVEANATQVETRSTGVGNVIETERILDLPLNGRQPTDLITLSGASATTAVSPGYTMRTGVRISVAGGSEYSVQYYLDGASHLDTYGGTGMPLPFPEALQEFKFSTSTQDASGSGHSGAVLNAVTKSGTNELHGDVFYFIRNAALNGRDFFSPTNDKLKRSQFGGVVGGAIKKDKLFYFLGYQGTIVRQTPSGTQAYVPTPAMEQGNFAAYLNPANNCPKLRFSAGVLNSADQLTIPLSPAALKISSYLPPALNACGFVITGNPVHENDIQAPARIDYQISDKQQFFARYLVTKVNVTTPHDLSPHDLLTTSGVGANDMSNSLTFGDTLVISPSIVNSARVFGNRVGSDKPHAETFGPSAVGIQDYYTYLPNFMAVSVSGGFNIGSNANFSTSTTGYTNFGGNDDVNIVHGSHQFAFGASVMRAILVGNSYAFAPGVFQFTGGITGNGLTDFLTGQVDTFHQANPNPNYSTQNFVGLYASDVWKVTSRLTVNLGLRWNPFIPLQFMQADTTNFSLSNFYGDIKSRVVPSAPPGFQFAGDSGFNSHAGMDAYYNHFEPRLGLAWDPIGDGKTVIRGGAGIAYDFTFQGVQQNASSVDPFRLTVVQNSVSLDNPYANIPGGNPFPYTYDRKNLVFQYNPPYQAFYLMPKNLHTPVQYQWNFGIQRQISRSLFLSSTYIGSEIAHLWQAIDLNPGQYIPGNCVAGQYGLTKPGPCTQAGNINQRRLLELRAPALAGTALGSMLQMDDGGTQSYNGLLTTASYRKNNVNLAANYTWSHCIGLPYGNTLNLTSAYVHEAFQNNGPVNRKLDYGDCVSGALDMRQIFNATAVIGTGKGLGNKFLRAMTSNWNVSTIYIHRTGWPITPYLGSDVAMNGIYAPTGTLTVAQRPNQVLTNASNPNQGKSCPTAPCEQWFNPAAFASPAPGAYGNLGIGSLRAPGFWEWDQALIRDFRITERQTVQFRAEAFNVTNSMRPYIAPVPNGDNSSKFGTPQFGEIYTDANTTGTSSVSNNQLVGSGGRVIQFALKYVF